MKVASAWEGLTSKLVHASVKISALISGIPSVWEEDEFILLSAAWESW